MRPHWRDSRVNRNAGEEEEQQQQQGSSSRSGRRNIDSDRRQPPLMSRPPSTREYHYQSGSRDTRSYYSGDDANVYDYGSRHQNWRRGEQDWQQRGGRWHDRASESGRHLSGYDTFRDYDRRRNYASTNWDQRDYGHNNSYIPDHNSTRYYDYTHPSNYGHRSPLYSRHSQSDNTGGYRNGNNSSQASRRDIHGDRRRGYHSSSSRPASSTHNDARNSSTNGSGGGDPPASDLATPQSLASRLFRHREIVTRFDPGRNIRNNRSTSPRPSLPNSLPPKPTTTSTAMKDQLGPTEAYLKTSLEKSERVGKANEDVDLDVNLENIVRKLLVLDLNGTLVYRSPHKRWHERSQPTNTATVTREAGVEEDVYAQFDPSQPRPPRTAFPRPYLKPFRDYLFHPSTKRWLDTMVWSSAQPHSVEDMVVKCFGSKKDELVAIWARDRLGLSQGDYSRKVQTTKDLNKPWDELNSTSSATPTNHSAKTTLLLDDSPLKAHLQPYNHLCIKEYDLDMRKHDIGVRELDLARDKLAGVIAGTQDIEDVLQKKTKKKRKSNNNEDIDVVAVVEQDDEDTTTPEHPSAAAIADVDTDTAGEARKRKRKEKKENKKKERIEEQLKKLTEGSENPNGVYDETLLAVIGILDAVKRESNVAAWIRGGGLIKSLIKGVGVVDDDEGGDDDQKIGEKKGVSDEPRSPSTPIEATKNSRKKTKPPRAATSPTSAESGAESETERTGVPLEDVSNAVEAKKGVKSVEEQLWFNHEGTTAYWALRGRRVLEGMGIDVVVGVVGPSG